MQGISEMFRSIICLVVFVCLFVCLFVLWWLAISQSDYRFLYLGVSSVSPYDTTRCHMRENFPAHFHGTYQIVLEGPAGPLPWHLSDCTGRSSLPASVALIRLYRKVQPSFGHILLQWLKVFFIYLIVLFPLNCHNTQV
jgi:hypothetical protein